MKTVPGLCPARHDWVLLCRTHSIASEAGLHTSRQSVGFQFRVEIRRATTYVSCALNPRAASQVAPFPAPTFGTLPHQPKAHRVAPRRPYLTAVQGHARAFFDPPPVPLHPSASCLQRLPSEAAIVAETPSTSLCLPPPLETFRRPRLVLHTSCRTRSTHWLCCGAGAGPRG